MRLREMFTILQDTEPKLEVRRSPVKSPDSQNWARLNGLSEIRNSVRGLVAVPGMEELASKALEHRLLAREYIDDPAVPLPLVEELVQLIKPLHDQVVAMRTAFAAALPPQDPHSIVVRLPDFELLSETADCMSELSKLLERVGAGRPVKIAVQNFDSGSLIIELLGEIAISLESASPGAATKAFAAAALYFWGLAGLSRKWDQEHRAHELRMRRFAEEHDETMRTRRLLNDGLEDSNRLALVLRGRIREEIEGSGPFTNEQLNNLTDLTLKLATLQEKGMKLLPASRADDDLKLLGHEANLQLLKDAKLLLLGPSTAPNESE